MFHAMGPWFFNKSPSEGFFSFHLMMNDNMIWYIITHHLMSHSMGAIFLVRLNNHDLIVLSFKIFQPSSHYNGISSIFFSCLDNWSNLPVTILLFFTQNFENLTRVRFLDKLSMKHLSSMDSTGLFHLSFLYISVHVVNPNIVETITKRC